MNRHGKEPNNEDRQLGEPDEPEDRQIDLDAVGADEHVVDILREIHVLGVAGMSRGIDLDARFRAVLADDRVRRLPPSLHVATESRTSPESEAEVATSTDSAQLNWLWLLAVGTFVALVGAWIAIDPFTHELTMNISDVAQALSAYAAGILCLRAGRRPSGPSAREADRMRAGWRLLGLSAFSWAAGQTAWTWLEITNGGEPPFPSVADIGFLIAVPFLILAMLTFLAAPTAAAQRAVGLLEWLGITFGLFIVVWSLVLGPTLTTSDGLSRVIGVIYPVADIVAASIAILVAARTEGKGPSVFRLVVFGVLALAVADSAFSHLMQTKQYATANFIDLGWIAGYCLIALAAIHPARASTDFVANPMGHRRIVLMVTAALAAVVAFTSGLQFGSTTDYAFVVIVAAFGMLATFLFTQLTTARSMENIAVDLGVLWQDDRLTSAASRAGEELRELLVVASAHAESGAEPVPPRVVERIGTIQAEVDQFASGVRLLNDRLDEMRVATAHGLYKSPWRSRERKGRARV